MSSLAWPLALLLAATAGLLGFVFRAAPLWQLDIGTTDDAHWLVGFHPRENVGGVTFRWTGPESQVVLHGGGAAPRTLTLRLAGPTGVRDHRVWLRSGGDGGSGAILATLEVKPGWRLYRVSVPAGAVAGSGLQPGRLALVSAQYFPAPEGRNVGVMVDELRLQAAEGPGGPWTPAAVRSRFSSGSWPSWLARCGASTGCSSGTAAGSRPRESALRSRRPQPSSCSGRGGTLTVWPGRWPPRRWRWVWRRSRCSRHD